MKSAVQQLTFDLPAVGSSSALGRELVSALQSHGYFYVKHPAMVGKLSGPNDIRRWSRWFFDPIRFPTFKEETFAPHGVRGYYRYVGASGVVDCIECFSVGRESETGSLPFRESYFRNLGWKKEDYQNYLGRPNAWPTAGATNGEGANAAQVQAFQQAVLDYYRACHDVSMSVLRQIASGLDLPQGASTNSAPEDLFVAGHSNMDHNLELKFYPTHLGPSSDGVQAAKKNVKKAKVLNRTGTCSNLTATPAAAATTIGETLPPPDSAKEQGQLVRLGTHRDLSSVTLLAQDQMGGLEVFDETTQSFIQVPVLHEDAVLVNAGIFLEKWTNGVVPATPHRVRYRTADERGESELGITAANQQKGRCSVVFFAFPDASAKINPLPIPDAPENFEPFTAADMMPVPLMAQ